MILVFSKWTRISRFLDSLARYLRESLWRQIFLFEENEATIGRIGIGWISPFWLFSTCNYIFVYYCPIYLSFNQVDTGLHVQMNSEHFLKRLKLSPLKICNNIKKTDLNRTLQPSPGQKFLIILITTFFTTKILWPVKF